ncbi:uncharacterized protein LOC125378176 [Haliotis rufescens]|uniref:uncharacterized protein LOC125378176 n=1 Tax=Haliotis rufescens TaxID=6454 RepID=UPI00201F2AF9|nr:uncharacterized protein LOC125378176 [Haliotis rufescens]
MAQVRVYEQLDDDGHTVYDAVEKVFYNVYSVLCMLQSTAMFITAAVYFQDCPDNIKLGIYLIVQAAVIVIIPILLCSVFRCGVRMTWVNYYSACVIVGLLCTACLIAGSYWLDVAECKSSTLYSIARGFIVTTWLLNSVFLVFSLIYRCCCRRYRDIG